MENRKDGKENSLMSESKICGQNRRQYEKFNIHTDSWQRFSFDITCGGQ